MEVLLPHSLDEALAIRAEQPEAVPLSGGTDLMVELNFGRARPPAIVDLNRVGELTAWREENGNVFLGSGVTYTTIVREMQAYKPLVQASRSVGSPQIRNRGTVGGSVGPTILRATEAEERVSAALTSSGTWDDRSAPLNPQSIDEFAELVATAAQPLDDVRGTVAYRRHGCRVLARRALGWALSEWRLPTWL